MTTQSYLVRRLPRLSLRDSLLLMDWIGGSRSLTTICGHRDSLSPIVESRKLPSDPISLDFGKDANLVYAGMRNASVLLTDLRTPCVSSTSICRVPGGKAVVGVKRLDDSAVPFGLVASAMGNEVSPYLAGQPV